nr:site-specific integrase [Frigoribacterium sp. VKM Ac-2530]
MQRELEDRGDLPTADRTVAQWFGYWYTQIVVNEVRPKTAAGYKNIIYQQVIPQIGNTKLNKVTPTTLRRVLDAMAHKGAAPSSMLKTHRVMSASFEAAIREGALTRNPCKMMTAPRRGVTKLEVLTRDEARLVIEHVSHDPDYGARWAVALLTGARRGEILGLEVDRITDVIDLSWQLQRVPWEHGCGPAIKTAKRRSYPCGQAQPIKCHERRFESPADYEYRMLTDGIYLTRPKSRAGSRIIPLVEPLKSIIKSHLGRNPPGRDGLVFTHGGNPVDPDRDSRDWRMILASTGIKKNVRLHDLRHTAVDLLYAAGVPEDVIVQLVGHSNVSMTRAYASRDVARLRAAMTQFSGHVTARDGDQQVSA